MKRKNNKIVEEGIKKIEEGKMWWWLYIFTIDQAVFKKGESRVHVGSMWGRCRVDIGLMWGRCRGDVGSMWDRCRVDVESMWGRCRVDVGSM